MAPIGRIALAGLLLASCPGAFALNPALNISQYGHHAWTVRDGFFQSSVTSIAQTPDGYLWLGTDLGLERFDGGRAVPWQPPAGQSLPSNKVTTGVGQGTRIEIRVPLSPAWSLRNTGAKHVHTSSGS